ncbi:MAG: DUF928 domain-containing protein [Gloeotrichia echinulata CP02]|jgi:hypothetical protein
MLYFHNYLITFIILAFTNVNFSVHFQPIYFTQTINNSDINKGLSFKGRKHKGKQSSGGSRPDCPVPKDEKRKLTALIPTSNWGKTTQGNPTLWFYVPYSPDQIKYGNFVLQDKNGEHEQRIKFNLPNTPGFVSFTLPKELELKEVGLEQQWFFELYCDPNKSPADVHGWIEKIEVSNTLQTLLDSSANKYKIYEENGIWYDTISDLFSLKPNQSPPELNFWKEQLLKREDVNLNNLPLEPLIGEVLLQKQ